jgi:hypothetical protein
MDTVSWEQIPGPPGYRPGRARAAVERLAAAGLPQQAGLAVAGLRFAVSNDHGGTLYPAVVPAVTIFIEVIDTMPGSAREEALTALLDWWGTFGPEPGFETYTGFQGGPAEMITDAIARRVRDAQSVLSRVAGEQSGRHRKPVMALFRCLDTGWTPQPLP